MSACALKLIAPFRCQFNLNTAQIIESRAEFNTFLKAINSDFSTAEERMLPGIPQGVAIKAVLRASESDANSRYSALDRAGSFFDSPKYFSIAFEETLQQNIEAFLRDAANDADAACQKKLSVALSPVTNSVDIGIYDNTIAILTLDVAIVDRLDDESWAQLDEWTTRLVFFFLDRLYKNYIYPTLQSINRYAQDRSEKRIRNPRDYVVFYDMSGNESDAARTRLLWTNRTLICPKGFTLNEWASRNIDTSHAINLHGALSHLNWGNNIIETDHDASVHDLSCVWHGMHLAQYYYAVLDVTGKNMKRFIGTTYDQKTNKELRALTRSMDAVINAVTIFQIEYKDIAMELQGLTKTVFRRLEKEWDFAALFENVQGKCALCKSHLELMNAYINQRNSLRVEIVLTGVGGVGFIGLMISLSSYGRALLREGYKSDIMGLLDIGQRLPPNLMVWIGIILAVAVAILVSANRTR